MKKYQWIVRQIAEPEAVAQIQQQLNNLPEALARTLVLRGIHTFDDAKSYFRPSLDHLHDPLSMRDMDAASDRLARAIETKEKVLVYGDYDVDGTTSTALMVDFLQSQGVAATYFIPNRFIHGYGLSEAGIDAAAAQGAALIVALDCGITAFEEAEYARELQIDLIICDHHTAGEETPNALAVLDPKRPDCPYPFKELSGCGVTFKLVQATLQKLGQNPEQAFEYLDLVAVSTASDIVPLVGENRILMRKGIERLEQAPRLGFRKLAEQASLDLDRLSVDRIVFSLGPRINAAGRMGEAARAVALMLSADEAEAKELAGFLEEANQQRRALDHEIQVQAIRAAERQMEHRMRHALVLHDAQWHQGIIGIVASRIVERFHRPAIMLCTNNGHAKGSARSISGVNIYEALKACEDLLIQFGGHDYAAGLSLLEENIPAFRDRLDEVVGAVMTPDMLFPSIEIDAELDLLDLDDRFWNVLRQFAPFGPENMTPIFVARNLEMIGTPRAIGNEGAHLRLKIRQRDANMPPRTVIAFGLGNYLKALQQWKQEGQPLEMVFSIEENVWQGRSTLQLRARDFRPQQVTMDNGQWTMDNG